MRYIMVLIWSLLISGVISYVLASMAGEPFNLTYVAVIALFFIIAISILAEGVIEEHED